MALKHQVSDTDNNFSINPTTRVIKNESVNKNMLVQYDHNSERFSFEIPKEVEGHEMDKCDKIEIHYVNIDAKTQQQSRGIYAVTDATVSDQDSSMLIFSWLIDGNATKYVGSLNFLVRFTCTDDEGNLLYVWNTAIHTGIMISNGLYITEFIMEDYKDELEKWKNECQAFRLVNLQQTQVSNESGGENIWTAEFEGLGERHLKVKNGKSAYQCAVESGAFEGSEREWAESIIYPEFYKDGVKIKKVKFELNDTTLSITTEE